MIKTALFVSCVAAAACAVEIKLETCASALSDIMTATSADVGTAMKEKTKAATTTTSADAGLGTGRRTLNMPKLPRLGERTERTDKQWKKMQD